MIIWLKHPQHGMKDCYSEGEAIECEKNGWARFDRDSEIASSPVKGVEQVEEPVVSSDSGDTLSEVEHTPVTEAPKKRGPKPKAKV